MHGPFIRGDIDSLFSAGEAFNEKLQQKIGFPVPVPRWWDEMMISENRPRSPGPIQQCQSVRALF